MPSFISVKKHVEVCKRLEREIESLRKQLDRCKDTAAHRRNERNEWKRRAEKLWEVTDELSQEELFALTPASYDLLEQATQWFEEE